MLNAGVDFIIAKPIDENELDDTLYRHSTALYQYQTHYRKPVFSGTIEEILMRLYIALDNLYHFLQIIRLSKFWKVPSNVYDAAGYLLRER